MCSCETVALYGLFIIFFSWQTIGLRISLDHKFAVSVHHISNLTQYPSVSIHYIYNLTQYPTVSIHHIYNLTQYPLCFGTPHL
jgi:hypothetical protein